MKIRRDRDSEERRRAERTETRWKMKNGKDEAG